MKSARVDNYGEKVKIEDVEIPKPGPKQILIEIKNCGFCHTDIHAIDGDWLAKAKMPLCPGHEGAGIVRAVGSEVDNFHEGDLAGVPWLYSACGSCEYCITGWETLCPYQENCGFSVDGCFRQYTIAAAKYAVPLPKELSLAQAAPILCAGVTAYKALKEAELQAGQFCCIIGAAGGLGHMAVQYGKAMGYRIIAMDVGEDKMLGLQKLGAEYTVDVGAHHEDADQMVKDYTSGGAHACIVFAAHPSSYHTALQAVRRKGMVICVSLPAGNLELNIVNIVLNRITVRGSIVGTRQDMKEALDFAARGLVHCEVKEESLNHVNEVIDDMKHNRVQGRVVFQM